MKTSISAWKTLLILGTLVLACNFLTNPVLNPPKGTVKPGEKTPPTATAQLTPAAEEAVVENDPLDHLLTMRSVKINLTSHHPDKTSRAIDVEIDSTGNMRVKTSRPVIDPSMLPEGVDLQGLPTSSEMFIVDGNAYMPSDIDPSWMTTPAETDYVMTLSGEMHDLDGFTIWLDILPDGSLQAAGTEVVGGMQTEKYTVNGEVDNQTITGTLWFEPQADALVQAELHVPAVLLSDPAQPEQGEYKFILNTQKTDILPVTLPSAPAGTSGGTATSNP